MKLGQWAGIAIGLWLMAAPALFDYAEFAAGDVHRTVGPFAAMFAVIALWEATRDVRLSNFAIAGVLVAAPAFAGHSTAAALVGLTAGLALAAATPFGGRVADQRGRGWRGLVVTEKGAAT